MIEDRGGSALHSEQLALRGVEFPLVDGTVLEQPHQLAELVGDRRALLDFDREGDVLRDLEFLTAGGVRVGVRGGLPGFALDLIR